MKIIKGFKGFEKGLVCRGKQYEVGKTYEENGTEICNEGLMHFCENPLDVLNYYPLINDKNEFNDFATVEADEKDTVKKDDKCGTRKLTIGAKLDLKGFIQASVRFIFELTEQNGGTSDKVQSSSGDWAQLASSGDWAQLASSGYGAQLASSGDGAQLASSGDGVKLASSGYGAQLASSGDGAKLASSGYGAKLSADGKNSVIASIGKNAIARGIIGTWITLAEYGADGICVYVKSAKIDGEKLKADTWYKLQNKRFVVVQ